MLPYWLDSDNGYLRLPPKQKITFRRRDRAELVDKRGAVRP